jgi:hypothetical protein
VFEQVQIVPRVASVQHAYGVVAYVGELAVARKLGLQFIDLLQIGIQIVHKVIHEHRAGHAHKRFPLLSNKKRRHALRECPDAIALKRL